MGVKGRKASPLSEAGMESSLTESLKNLFF